MDVDLYARLSVNRDGTSHSVGNQLEAARKYAAERGWTVVDEYSDDSFSATSGVVRPDFERLLSRPVHRPVVAFNDDRMVRSPKDLERVLDTGMTVYYLHAGHVDLSTPGGRAVARTLVAWAYHEIEVRTERQRLANDARAAEGEPYWRVAPLGHTLTGQEVHSEADVIRQAASDLLAGTESLRSIARRWNAEGVRTSKGGTMWRGTSVREVLTAPRMVGTLVYKGQTMPKSTIEPLLEADTWHALRTLLEPSERRSGPKSGGRTANLLTGIAECGICMDGSTVTAASYRHRGQRHEVYRCQSVSHCRHYREETDSIIWSHLAAHIHAHPESVRSGGVDVAAAADVARLSDKIAQWATAADSGEISVGEYVRFTAPLKEELAAAEARLGSGSAVDVFKGLPAPTDDETTQAWSDAFSAWWDALSLERQREVVARLFRVVLLPRSNRAGRADDQYVEVTPI